MLPLSLRGSLQGPWTSPHPRQAGPGVRLQLSLSRVQTLSAPPGLSSTCCTCRAFQHRAGGVTASWGRVLCSHGS